MLPSQLVDADPLWQGRGWGPALSYRANRCSNVSIRCLSYHVLADSKCSLLSYTTAKSWEARSVTLVKEISSYGADFVMLQDVDHFNDWWQPQLMLVGYDSIFGRRTQRNDHHDEGVVISYRRDKFQLFKSVVVPLNDCAQEERPMLAERCLTDDVGLLAFLQPLGEFPFGTAICVGCAAFCDREGFGDVRAIQAKYFCRQIEKANSEFQLPVVIGVSLHDEPTSEAYHILRTGRIALSQQGPRKCQPPVAEPISRSSLKLKWFPPLMAPNEALIHSYRLSWRPGGSLPLGFSSQIIVGAGDCSQFVDKLNSKGEIRAVPLEELAFTVTGLTSELPYEFKVTAISDIGQGEPSEASEPIVLRNALKAPPMPPLRTLRNLEQVKELREVTQMHTMDWDVEKAHVDDAHLSATQQTPRLLDGRRNMEVPRGKVLPSAVNPRDGWKSNLFGAKNTVLQDIMNHKDAFKKSIFRTVNGLSSQVSDTATGMLMDYLDSDESDPDDQLPTIIEESQLESSQEQSGKQLPNASIFKEEREKDEWDDSDGEEKENGPGFHESLAFSASSELETPGNLTKEFPDADSMDDQSLQPESIDSSIEISNANTVYSKSESILQTLAVTSKMEERRRKKRNDVEGDVLLDCKSVIRTLGKPNIRQVHDLNLRSGYEGYSTGGEPLYTSSCPVESGKGGCHCLDYVFYSAWNLHCSRNLVLPPLALLQGNDCRQTMTSVDEYWLRPPASQEAIFNRNESLGAKIIKSNAGALSHTQREQYMDELRQKLDLSIVGGRGKKNEFWGGMWVPLTKPNPLRTHHWLPNDSFCSSHLALGVQLEVISNFSTTQWKQSN